MGKIRSVFGVLFLVLASFGVAEAARSIYGAEVKTLNSYLGWVDPFRSPKSAHQTRFRVADSQRFSSRVVSDSKKTSKELKGANSSLSSSCKKDPICFGLNQRVALARKNKEFAKAFAKDLCVYDRLSDSRSRAAKPKKLGSRASETERGSTRKFAKECSQSLKDPVKALEFIENNAGLQGMLAKAEDLAKKRFPPADPNFVGPVPTVAPPPAPVVPGFAEPESEASPNPVSGGISMPDVTGSGGSGR